MDDPASDPSESDSESPSQSSGIFISRGVSLRISNLSLVFGPDGIEVPPITTEVLLTMNPFWLEIAMGHLEAAEAAHAAVLASHESGESNKLGLFLEAEFTAGMQAIVAAATAIDSLYASVREHVELPEEVVESWRKNRTARHKQVSEVLRRAFKLKTRGADNLRTVLMQIYRFRDFAVHPSGKFSAPVAHPEIGTGIEWRFIAFGAPNANQLVRAALAFTALLVRKSPEDADDTFAKLCNGVDGLITPLISTWKAKYGPLTDEDQDL